MAAEICPEPAIIVIFGAGGDLTWRKLIPALYNLFLDKWLPDRFAVLGLDRKAISDDELRHHLRQGAEEFSRRGKVDDKAWNEFASHLAAFPADLTDPATYATLADRLSALDKKWNSQANHIFYQATPPTMVETIVQQLGNVRLSHNRKRSRIVLEKPFGRDLASAQALNQMLTRVFGVEHRGSYYDYAGALRDMIQNHLLQVLCLVAIEAPVSFDADEIRNKKLDVLHAIRHISQEQVHLFAVRGQYGAGWVQGERVPTYRAEPGVAPDSSTETFAAVKLFVDNWPWQDVPFYLRTGKRLLAHDSEVIIQFRDVPHRSFSSTAVGDWQPNCLAIHLQPDEGILLRFQAKQPGPKVRLSSVGMRFTYREAFQTTSPEAYETLLLDVMLGDATLFMRADQVEAAWSVVNPILEGWQAVSQPDFPNYPAGTWGPEAAEALIAQDGRNWLLPSIIGG